MSNYDYITVIRHGGHCCVSGHSSNYSELKRFNGVKRKYPHGKGAPKYIDVYKRVINEGE